MAAHQPHRAYMKRDPHWEQLIRGNDRVLGRVCMETDILLSQVCLPASLRVGDLIAIADAGAYDTSMAFPFGTGHSFNE